MVLTTKELMQKLKIGKNTAYELLQTKQIRAIKVGAEYRIPIEEVEAFIKRQLGEGEVN